MTRGKESSFLKGSREKLEKRSNAHQSHPGPGTSEEKREGNGGKKEMKRVVFLKTLGRSSRPNRGNTRRRPGTSQKDVSGDSWGVSVAGLETTVCQ